MPLEKLLGADVRISDLGLVTEDRGTSHMSRRLRLGRLETDGLEGKVGALSYHAGALSIDGLSTTFGRKQISAQAADVSDLRASTDSGVSLRLGHIGFPRGLLFTSQEELHAPQVIIEDAHLVIEDLGALSRGERDPDDQGRMDLHFLDVLQGQLNIDLAVDMTLPWVGRRRVTHYFRVPIENGTIDYSKLEDDVHWLEATFLTVDLVKDTLVLARDLPLVPYAGKALLRWPLEPKDVPVAMLRRVHVRNLLRWELPASDRRQRDRKERSRKLMLHALAMKNIDLSLRASGPAQVELPGHAMLRFGDDTAPGLTGLKVEGELRYSATGDTSSTSLRGGIQLMDVTLNDLALGAASLSVDRLHVEGIDSIEVGFDGFRPRRLEMRVSRMDASNLRLRVP